MTISSEILTVLAKFLLPQGMSPLIAFNVIWSNKHVQMHRSTFLELKTVEISFHILISFLMIISKDIVGPHLSIGPTPPEQAALKHA